MNTSATLALHVATGFYLTNVALGVAVRLRVLSTSGFGWVHHMLFAVVVLTTVVAVGLGLHEHARFAWGLLPGLAVFAVLPCLAGGTARHTLAALVAGAAYVAAYALT